MSASIVTPQADPAADLRAALARLRQEAVDFAAAKLGAWREQAKGVEQAGGATDRAVVAGVSAAVTGGNPVRAALAGAWAGADAGKRAQIIGVVLLLVLLAPVVLLLLLLALLVAAVLAARAGTAPPSVDDLLGRIGRLAS